MPRDVNPDFLCGRSSLADQSKKEGDVSIQQLAVLGRDGRIQQPQGLCA